MFMYEKRLMYPVSIKKANNKLAKIISAENEPLTSECNSASAYLLQRCIVPYPEITALLTDISIEKLGHIEVFCAILYQLTTVTCEKEEEITKRLSKNGSSDRTSNFHRFSKFPEYTRTNGYEKASFTGDPIADLASAMATEQRLRAIYEKILCQIDDTEVSGPISFLRARKIVHYQRLGEALQLLVGRMGADVYAFDSIPENLTEKKNPCPEKP